MEYGIIIPQGIINIDRHLPRILEDAENELTVQARQFIFSLHQEFVELTDKVAQVEKQLR